MQPPTPRTGLEPVMTRRISGKHYLGLHLAMLVLAAGIWAAAIFMQGASVPPLWIAAGFVPIFLGWAYAAIARRARTYRLHRESLEVERGLLSREIDNLQLFRVRDVALKQGILDRILDVGDVIITSTDTTSPRLTVRGIDDPRAFYTSLREHAAQQAEKRTMIVEGNVTPPGHEP